MTTQQLAERVGLSTSPCARRVKILEQAGIIKGYSAVIDEAAFGLMVSAFASVKLVRQHEDDLDRFGRAVARWPEVVDCYLMTGQRDYLLRVLVRDLREYEAFLKNKLTRLEEVASIETSFALTQVKRSHVVPIA
jgi:Lrp/AsnC family leucine-responsive transcriptional regulator